MAVAVLQAYAVLDSIWSSSVQLDGPHRAGFSALQKTSARFSFHLDQNRRLCVTWSVFVLSRSSISERGGPKIHPAATGPGPHALINSFWYTKACVEACERTPHAAPPPPYRHLLKRPLLSLQRHFWMRWSICLALRAITIITQKCCTRVSERSGKTAGSTHPRHTKEVWPWDYTQKFHLGFFHVFLAPRARGSIFSRRHQDNRKLDSRCYAEGWKGVFFYERDTDGGIRENFYYRRGVFLLVRVLTILYYICQRFLAFFGWIEMERRMVDWDRHAAVSTAAHNSKLGLIISNLFLACLGSYLRMNVCFE